MTDTEVTILTTPEKRTAEELLTFAEAHPEQFVRKLESYWAMAGAGFREECFNIRGVIESCIEDHDEAEAAKFVKPDPSGCGIGKGDECCAYLAVSGDGLECLRTTRQGKATIAAHVHAMTAKRLPEEAWPGCMDAATDAVRDPAPR